MTTRSVDNYQNIENYNDVIDVLVQENAINNIPNSSNSVGGEIAVWNGITWALEGNTSLWIGLGGGLTFQGSNCVAVGHQAGRHSQNTLGIAIGFSAGRTHQGTSAVAIGYLAGSLTQGQNAVAIGLNAGEIAQGNNSIALGYRAGTFTQGTNSIAIGFNAGLTSQPANSIVINSSGSTVNGITTSSCYIAPIRNVVTNSLTSNYLCYDDTNREVIQASNIQYANPVSFSSGTVTQTSVNFGTLNTGIFSSSANSLNVSVAGTQRMDLTGSRLSLNVPVQNIAGSQSAPSLYFSTDTTSGIYRPALNNVAITTNSLLRFNVTTSAINCSLPITLQTTGGTPSNLDYYEETTFASAFTYGNTTIASITMSIIRIGKQTTLYVPISVTQTNTNGSASVISLNTSFPSRFRPNAQITLPFYLNNGGTIGIHSITIFTDGNITIAQNSGAGFANNTSVVYVANALSWIN